MSATTETTEAAISTGRSMTFTSAIRETAQRLGRAPSAEQVEDLNSALQTLGRIAEDGTVEVLQNGKAMPIGAFLAGEVTRFPLAAPEQDSTVAGGEFVKVQIGSSTSYRRADDAMVRITQGFDAAGAADIATEAASWPNPWIKGKENRTRQTVITNTDPALAARFKAEARA